MKKLSLSVKGLLLFLKTRVFQMTGRDGNEQWMMPFFRKVYHRKNGFNYDRATNRFSPCALLVLVLHFYDPEPIRLDCFQNNHQIFLQGSITMKFYSTVKNTELSFTDLVCTNSKLEKSVIGHATKIVGLPLAPSGASGRNVCQHSTDACRQACVTWFSGRKVMQSVRDAAIARTIFFFEHQTAFFGLLRAELGIELAKAQMAGEQLYFRPNESSDLPWERFSDMPWLTPCYDYSAIVSRVLKSLAWDFDYQLTLSIKETTTVAQARSVLDNGGNVACVVDTTYNPQSKKFGILPSVVSIGGKEYQTVDGDVHDLRRREIDGTGKVILLRLKGTNAAKKSARDLGFAKAIENYGISNSLTMVDSGSVLTLN